LFHWELVDCKTASWSAATLHRCEASRISIGLKSCCIGNRGAAGEFVGFSQVIFHHHPSTRSSLRRSGHPLSSWYQISSVYSVSIHKSIPVDLLFFVLSRKSHTKICRFRFCLSPRLHRFTSFSCWSFFLCVACSCPSRRSLGLNSESFSSFCRGTVFCRGYVFQCFVEFRQVFVNARHSFVSFSCRASVSETVSDSNFDRP
jgi:hypothetical protein